MDTALPVAENRFFECNAAAAAEKSYRQSGALFPTRSAFAEEKKA